jgi:hypothetical protein
MLTPEEKLNGLRAVLIPSADIQSSMQPYDRQGFNQIIQRANVPSPKPSSKAR